MSSLSQSSLTVRTYGPSRGSHSHDHFQVIWTLDGCLELEVEGRGTRLSRGSGFVIAPSERHDFESLHGSQCLVLDTSRPIWGALNRQPHWTPAVDLLAQSLALCLRNGVPFSANYGTGLFAQLWGMPVSPQRVRRPIDWDGLTRWACMRLSAQLTVADLATRTHLSETQFRARCLEEQGCTPATWIRRLRLDKAAALRANGASAMDAARQVGYESAAALATARRRSGRV